MGAVSIPKNTAGTEPMSGPKMGIMLDTATKIEMSPAYLICKIAQGTKVSTPIISEQNALPVKNVKNISSVSFNT